MVKPVNPFIARILDPADEVTMFEITAHNARVARAIAEQGARKRCDPDKCRISHCHHGNPTWVAEQHAHADVLEREAIALAQEMT